MDRAPGTSQRIQAPAQEEVGALPDELPIDQAELVAPLTEAPPVGGIYEPLWKVRLRLLWRGLRANWALFVENKIGLIGLAIIAIFALMAIAHPVLMATVWEKRVYDPQVGYEALLEEFTVVEEVTDPTTQIEVGRARVRTNPFVDVGDQIFIPAQPASPSARHPLGTDPLGRDVLSQLMFSTRAAFALAAVAALVTVFIATSVGSVAAYYGGVIDGLLMRMADLVLIMPLLAVLIVVSALFDISLPLLGVLIGILSGFGATAIVLKSQALSVKVKPFIDAARVAGGSHRHIILRHIVPNVMPLSFLYMMFTVTEAISIEAVLSFFGLLDVDMSWGVMLSVANTQGYLLAGTDFWWLLLPAGAAVTFLAAAFFLVGRALDEIVNPRLRRR
ncbi:MAG: ABC transporter permease [Actinomycetota bacterium]